jgi:hypothetical protein
MKNRSYSRRVGKFSTGQFLRIFCMALKRFVCAVIILSQQTIVDIFIPRATRNENQKKQT